jgi:predicted Zn-dependent protease
MDLLLWHPELPFLWFEAAIVLSRGRLHPCLSERLFQISAEKTGLEETLYHVANHQFGASRIEEALATIRRCMRIDLEKAGELLRVNHYHVHLLVQILIETEERANAHEALEIVRRFDGMSRWGKDPKFWRLLSRAHRTLGDTGEAQRCLERADELLGE